MVPVADVLQEVLSGWSLQFLAQNLISEVYTGHPATGPRVICLASVCLERMKDLNYPGQKPSLPNKLYRRAKLHPAFLWH